MTCFNRTERREVTEAQRKTAYLALSDLPDFEVVAQPRPELFDVIARFGPPDSVVEESFTEYGASGQREPSGLRTSRNLFPPRATINPRFTMAKPKRPEVTFEYVRARVESLLDGTTRREILTEILKSRSFGNALRRLRDQMRAHRFSGSGREISIASEMEKLDQRTREDGFHVLHDWDGVADRLNDETIPVDVANYLLRATIPDEAGERTLAILLDYYFFYALALLSMRAWDEGDPSENFDRLTRLLGALQGENGSGHQFVETAETFIPVATSHFEPDVRAFDKLLDRVRGLDEPHRLRFALSYAAILSSHLRFGFQATYGRDVSKMRTDNAPDYPWLLFALATLMEAYARNLEGAERLAVVEGLLNGLTPDPRAFVGTPPPSLSESEAEISRFVELFRKFAPELLKEFESHRPSEERYSPVAFFFNFPHNLLKAMVVDALLHGKAWNVSLDDLLTGVPPRPGSEERTAAATTLMGYARSSPDRIRGQLVPAIVYDPRRGLKAFRDTIGKLSG